jgi:thioredoxin reductase (NADPH)
MENEMRVVIVGAGPAGLATVVALAESGVKATVLEQMAPGGEALNVQGEMYPSRAFSGSEVVARLTEDAFGYDADFQMTQVTGVEQRPDGLIVCGDGLRLDADAVVIASGLEHTGLPVPGAAEFAGRGLSTCASCDGPMFRPGPVLVTGSTRHALWEAATLSAQGLPVILATSSAALECRLGQQLRADSKIDIRADATPVQVSGDGRVGSVTLRQGGTEQAVEVTGVIAADVRPHAGFADDLVERDGGGAIKVDHELRSSHPAVYAAGEVRSGFPGYIVAAVADGLTAAAGILRGLGAEGSRR